MASGVTSQVMKANIRKLPCPTAQPCSVILSAGNRHGESSKEGGGTEPQKPWSSVHV